MTHRKYILLNTYSNGSVLPNLMCTIYRKNLVQGGNTLRREKGSQSKSYRFSYTVARSHSICCVQDKNCADEKDLQREVRTNVKLNLHDRTYTVLYLF